MNPKDRIFKKAGSATRVARWCGVNPSQCSRWEHIPAKHQQAILDGAAADGVAIRPEDFFERVPDLESPSEQAIAAAQAQAAAS